jgi:hypothetical protein
MDITLHQDYLPGAIGTIAALHGTYYARTWGLGAVFAQEPEHLFLKLHFYPCNCMRKIDLSIQPFLSDAAAGWDMIQIGMRRTGVGVIIRLCCNGSRVSQRKYMVFSIILHW